ncbi:MAG: T9SS type A sorting domain-containing protein [Flavihumibacter sp.]
MKRFYSAVFPLFLALLMHRPAHAQTYFDLNWGSSFVPAWGDGSKSGTAPSIVPGLSATVNFVNTQPGSELTIVGSNNIYTPAVSPANNRAGFFWCPNTTALIEIDVDWTKKTHSITADIVFDQPVYDLSFYVVDIDKSAPKSNNFVDRVTITGYNGSTSVNSTLPKNPTITFVQSTAPPFLTVAGTAVSANSASGVGGNAGSSNNSDQQGTVWVNFTNATGVTRISIKYDNGSDAPTDPSPQAIGISNLRFTVPVISGTVWHDADNSANNSFSNIRTNSEPATNAGGLYVNLVNAANLVIATAPVNSNGTYSLVMPRNTIGMRLQLSANQGVVGSVMPASSVPAGWEATSPQVSSGFSSTSTDITGMDFGVNNLPETAVRTQASVANPGDYDFYTIPASAFQGSGSSQTTDASPGTVQQIRITSFPTNTNYIQIGSTIYSNGGACAPAASCVAWPADGVTVNYTNGTGTVPVIAIDPVDGAVTSVISFAAIDNAGSEDPTPGSVSQPFIVSTITISGYLFNDANGDQTRQSSEAKISGTNGTSGGSITTLNTIYAVLSNASGKVIAIQQLGADGSYSFAGAPGNASYISIRVTTTYAAVGAAMPAVTLPAGWIITGENGNGSIDPVIDGEIILSKGTSNISNQLFGWERLPVADPKTYTISTPLSNSTLVLNGTGSQPGPLSGTDAEDGTLGAAGKVAITTLPLNGNLLYYNGTQITTGADGINPPSESNPFLISSYAVNQLSVRIVGLGDAGVSFRYAWIDNAGQQGASVSYTVNWAFVLPAGITSFTATTSGTTALLNWSVENQQLYDHYEVYYSFDNLHFSKAGVVATTAAAAGNYQFRQDMKQAGATKIYYRLLLVDKNGQSRYSETLVVKSAGTATIVFPTLLMAGEPLYVYSAALNATVQVVDANGQLAWQQPAGNGSVIQLQTGQWRPGIYIVRLQSDAGQVTQKIVVQR